MTTKVVNRHHGDSYDVYIGRGSVWGNPYTHLDSTQALYKVDSREQAIEEYFGYIFAQRNLLSRLSELKGKVLGCYCHPKSCHGHILAQLADTTWWKDDKLILECSTKGDIRFSAFGAEVTVFGKKATVEEHYQLSKRFVTNTLDMMNNNLYAPKSIYDVKGKNAKTKDMSLYLIFVNGFYFPPDFRLEFYKWMWLKYLDENPELVAYASRFDDYNDIFKGKSIICQADCIRQYIKQGRDSVVSDIKDFCEMIGVEA
jgi:hypothetical protein